MPAVAADMIEISSLTALLAVESIIVLVTALAFFILGAARQTKREQEQTGQLVERLSQVDGSPQAGMEGVLSVSSGLLPEEIRRETVETVKQRERALYRQVIQAFLTRDTAVLQQIDRHVQALSKPYCRLVEELLQRPAANDVTALQAQQLLELTAANEQLQQRVQELMSENEQAQQQIRDMLKTLDEVSTEYARIFSEQREGSADLQISKARMLRHFRLAAGLPDHDEPITDTTPEP